MNLLYPRLTLRHFRWLLLFATAGAGVAGIYGILHDQVTYSLGPEYFTRLKFGQFSYLDKDQPARLIVAEIGFLATWWVGFFSAWFMGRLTIPHEPLPLAAQRSLRGVLVILATALASAIIAFSLAPAQLQDSRLEHWAAMIAQLRVTDSVSFVRVAYIHNASYLGGLVGLIGVLVWLRLSRKQ